MPFCRSKIGVISWNPLKTSRKVFFTYPKHTDRRIVPKNWTSNQSVIKMKHMACRKYPYKRFDRANNSLSSETLQLKITTSVAEKSTKYCQNEIFDILTLTIEIHYHCYLYNFSKVGQNELKFWICRFSNTSFLFMQKSRVFKIRHMPMRFRSGGILMSPLLIIRINIFFKIYPS